MTEPTYFTRLQRVLAEEGRKQRWLAEKVGVSEALISNICYGRHVSDDLKQKIATTLNRDVADLFPTRLAEAA